MRDFEAERPVAKGVRRYGSVTKVGRLSPYNELLQAINSASKELADQDRKSLQRLAWFLGMNGETHACEVIMEHAKEPVPYGGVYMYGYPPVG